MITRRISGVLSGLAAAESGGAWTCASCRRASRPLPSQRQSPLTRFQQTRSLFNVPRLAHNEIFERDGVRGLYSAAGYKIGWKMNMAGLTQKLNELTAGLPENNAQCKDLVLRYARDPMSASLFNHASMAHNVEFFYRGFSTKPLELEYQPGLQQSLERSFGSIDTLRTTMLDTAAGMFGPGFVWLVWANGPGGMGKSTQGEGWRILNTYSAGTPYPEAGYRQQSVDMNNQHTQPQNTAGQFGQYSRTAKDNARVPPGGTKLTPVLCVNTWEHAYLPDFGVDRKRLYLSAWWNAIDWHTVFENAPPGAARGEPSANKFSSSGWRG
ncbi:hypothetical protein MBLNU230_g5871t1 [Neophaeotheca triangularis]